MCFFFQRITIENIACYYSLFSNIIKPNTDILRPMSNTSIHMELITLPVVYIASCNVHTIDNYNEQKKKNEKVIQTSKVTTQPQ
jgi:hypothetical protein